MLGREKGSSLAWADEKFFLGLSVCFYLQPSNRGLDERWVRRLNNLYSRAGWPLTWDDMMMTMMIPTSYDMSLTLTVCIVGSVYVRFQPSNHVFLRA